MDTERREHLIRFLGHYGLHPEADTLDLFDEALTHRSFAFEKSVSYDNERLEFLGDAIIGMLAAEHVFSCFKEASEGELSKRKGRLVSRTILGRRAREMNLSSVVRLGRGEDQTGGRHRPVLLGSALEALVGAIYLSLGWPVAVRFVRTHILDPLRDVVGGSELSDYKSQLQELVQKRYQVTPEYRIVREIGPDHAKRFLVEVLVKGKKWGEGWGERKKVAENEAARFALEQQGVVKPKRQVFPVRTPRLRRDVDASGK